MLNSIKEISLELESIIAFIKNHNELNAQQLVISEIEFKVKGKDQELVLVKNQKFD